MQPPGKKRKWRRGRVCHCLCRFRARGLDPLCSGSAAWQGGYFFLRNEEALGIEACDVADSFDVWLKQEAPLAAGFFAVAGSLGASACRLRFGSWRFPSLSTRLQPAPVPAELVLADEWLPRQDFSTLTTSSSKAVSSSRGPRDEAAMSAQGGLLLLGALAVPGPAGLTNCVPFPLPVFELPVSEGGLGSGASSS